MSHIQSDDTFKAIDQLVWKHLEDRDWDHPSPRSLAISLSLEANELLEHYQWRDEPIGNKEAQASELADILIYAFEFAHVVGIDPAEAIRAKLIKSAQKYPAEHYKDKSDAEKREQWVKAKIAHRAQKKTL